MSNKDVFFPPHYLDCKRMTWNIFERDWHDAPCLFNMVVAIFLYVDDVFLISESKVGPQRIMNKLNEFYTSSSFEVELSKTTTKGN